MHKHLIKWLSKIIEKERGLPHMLAPRRRYLDYLKVYCDVTERCLLAWNQSKHIIYYIFHILIPKSLLVLHTLAPTSFDLVGFDPCFTVLKF